MSSSNSPCAACKFLRRKCTQECVFAPYFPPDQPRKFENVHKVFGASNVAKLLNELNATQREDAVNSLAYEAEYRLRDPVYGCVGLISILQHKLKQVQDDLLNAKKDLATYIGPQAMLPMLQHSGYIQQHPNNPSSSNMIAYNMQPMGLQTGMMQQQLMMRDPQQQQQQNQQQVIEAHQLAAVMAAREQEMMRTYEQPQQQQQFNNGYDSAGPVTATGFHQMSSSVSPSLALASFDNDSYQIQQAQQEQHHVQVQPHQLLQQQQQLPQQPQTPQQQQRANSEEERSIGPSC
ncbi:LOB domain-containing protein 36-like isoform X2 [Solanum stenotomum]|uniref:LOB domain-containing protein 36-like isoform X2 n=1 Tax=Solanum stenotomum TaxID=172797 RepID=UPI0020D1EF0E|nr:LOB domain-containing protein 36-like isoform X2 [Solanum stenotomum]